MTTASDQPTAPVATDRVGVVDDLLDGSAGQPVAPLDRGQRPRRRRLRRRPRSRSSRVSTRSASAPACTSARPASAACTTWCTEVVDNSVDEALAGYCDLIDVTLLADGGVRVIDNGRGIPVDSVAGEGRPAVEVVLTVLHAGGKFGGGGYSVSGGLHGVGVSVVNALSRRLEVEVRRDGYVWTPVLRPVVPGGARSRRAQPVDDTGTTVTFWADGDIFETTDYDFETLSRRFQEMAFLNKGLRLTLRDERPEHEDTSDEADDVTSRPARPRPGRRRRSKARRASVRSATATTTASSTSSSTSTPARARRTARSSPSRPSPRPPSRGNP